MTKSQQYTGKDIKALNDRDHVRLRTQIYLGNTHSTTYQIPVLSESSFKLETVEFIPAVYKAIGEIIDNSLDEFAHLNIKNKLLEITANPETGAYTISDNGRGIPIDKHSTGKYTPEVALSSLRAGRNFTDDKEVGVIGQNGVGSACTNYCSSDFEVIIQRDGTRYHQKFIDGAQKISTPKLTKTLSKETGTTIKFQLDAQVFESVALPEILVKNRAIEIAMTNPGLTVEYNGEKFKFKNGLAEIVERFGKDKFHIFTIDEPNVTGEFYILFDTQTSIDEMMFTWINSSMLFDGGKINTQFFNAFFDKVIGQLEREAKKQKSEVTRNDVRENLLVFANIRVKNPEYDSQAKTRLTGPDLRKELNGMLETQWKKFVQKNHVWLASVLEKANERHHINENKKAINDHQKGLNRRVVGLLDATSRDRSECQILITEGDSAKSQISEVRNPKTTAAFALSGKINNVYGNTPAQALKMEKLTTLLTAIGLTPGKRAARNTLNYSKIVIATDSDFDGDDIFTLLINMFYQFWPELFDKQYPPIIHRLVAPNVCLIKGNQRIHFTTRAEYDREKNKYTGYTVRYYKGLGSMAPADWEMILSGKTNTLVSILDDGQIGNTMNLLFSENADARKAWLTTE